MSNEIADKFGTFHALELSILRDSDSIIGKMPKGRYDFDPVLFQQRVFGTEDEIEILDPKKAAPWMGKNK